MLLPYLHINALTLCYCKHVQRCYVEKTTEIYSCQIHSSLMPAASSYNRPLPNAFGYNESYDIVGGPPAVIKPVCFICIFLYSCMPLSLFVACGTRNDASFCRFAEKTNVVDQVSRPGNPRQVACRGDFSGATDEGVPCGLYTSRARWVCEFTG